MGRICPFRSEGGKVRNRRNYVPPFRRGEGLPSYSNAVIMRSPPGDRTHSEKDYRRGRLGVSSAMILAYCLLASTERAKM